MKTYEAWVRVEAIVKVKAEDGLSGEALENLVYNAVRDGDIEVESIEICGEIKEAKT